MLIDRAVTRPSSEPVSMKPIVDRQTPVKHFLPLRSVTKQEKYLMCTRKYKGVFTRKEIQSVIRTDKNDLRGNTK